MPTYAYRGTVCDHQFDYVQKFADQPLTECIECGGPVRRVYSAVGVVFKGSGWYINDSRKSSGGNVSKDNGSPESNGKVDVAGAKDSTDVKAASKESGKADAPAKAKATAD